MATHVRRPAPAQEEIIDPGCSGPDEFVLWEFVTRRAEAFPDRVAVTQDGVDVTWGELDASSDRLAIYLMSLGVGPGDRVAHFDGNTVVALELLFAVSKLGAIMIPVNWRLSVPELAALVTDMGPTVILCGARFAAQAQALREARGGWLLSTYDESTSLPWMNSCRLSEYHHGAPTDTVLQLCTSGTTGTPRGVELTNLSLYPHLAGIGPIWKFTADTVTLVAMPLFHVSGLGWFLACLSASGRAVLARQVVPEELLDLMVQHRVTNFLLVPTVVRAVCAVPGASQRDWSALKVLAYGGAPMPADTLRQAIATFDCATIEVYGMSETAGAFCGRETTSDGTDAIDDLIKPVGHMYPWMQVRILDLETGCPVDGPDVVGEIEVKGPQLMSRYFDNPVATAAVMDGDWLRTGDSGYLNDLGDLYLVGRVKDMIISGGENIYPAEIENVLTLHESVEEVALVGVPDIHWGEIAVAFVVPTTGHKTETLVEELMAFARAHLAGYKVPKQINFVEALPKNTTGKVLKRQIKAIIAATHD
jgi:long-chain acyl-CoA synthetase